MLYLIAKIDRSARARLSWIQSFGASFGIVPKPIYGHILLDAFEDGNEAELIRDSEARCIGRRAFSVAYESIAIMAETSSIAAVAGQSEELSALRSEQGAWIPHTTLIRDDLVNLNWVKMAMDEMFQPFEARVERIELVRETRNGPEPVAGWDLT